MILFFREQYISEHMGDSAQEILREYLISLSIGLYMLLTFDIKSK